MPKMFKESLLKTQISLFEKEQSEATETDRIMNRLSKESIIKSSSNPSHTSKIFREIDIDGLQQYISLIDGTKQEIRKT